MASDLNAIRTPARVLCLEVGAARWADVPTVALPHLQHAVACGSQIARAPLADGRWHVFDFARKFRYDEADPAAPPAALAWVDEGGNKFFPAGVFEPSGPRAVSEAEAIAVVRSWTLDGAVLTGARRCVPVASLLRMFAEREETTGNVKLGWYGGSPEDVHTAGDVFFRRSNWPLLGGDRAHGRGMHLSPLRFPHLSMSIAEADDKGQAHVLLCRIVQGRPEVAQAGSEWFGYRMEQKRSVGGVDNLFNPSWYVIWSKYTNSCIMPLCIVSFTKHPMIQDLGPAPIPVTVNMQKLHTEFKKFLPSSKLQDLETSMLTWGTHIISPEPSVSLLVLQCSLVQS